MNAVTTNSDDISFTQGGSSSDTEETISDESPLEYYEPLSNGAIDDDEDSDSSDNDQEPANDVVNGEVGCVENGMRYLDLSNEEEEEEEEIRMREATQRAFVEDESRRRAPLTEENTMRVMEAMRGVSFAGLVPDWAGEDRWLDQLARIRQQSSSSSS